jgi:uncharacterized membrane protein YphA (DoxX/SURF4 family)
MQALTLDTSAVRENTVAAHSGKAIGRYAQHTARVMMGLIFFVFGLNGVLQFIAPPPPEAIPAGAAAFSAAMMQTGYLFQLVVGVEVLAGALLLLNRFVPLALTLIAPVIVNIVLFHLYLSPMGTEIAFVVLALELFLAWRHRNVFRPMLSVR